MLSTRTIWTVRLSVAAVLQGGRDNGARGRVEIDRERLTAGGELARLDVRIDAVRGENEDVAGRDRCLQIVDFDGSVHAERAAEIALRRRRPRRDDPIVSCSSELPVRR